MAMQRKISAVFKAWKARPLLHPRYGIFEPEPSRWETSETDGQVERPTERVRRSQWPRVDSIRRVDAQVLSKSKLQFSNASVQRCRATSRARNRIHLLLHGS